MSKKEKKVKEIDITDIKPIDKKQTESVKGKTKSKGIKQMLKNNRAMIFAYVIVGLAIFTCMYVISAQLNTVANTNIISEGLREAELLSELAKMKENYTNLKEDYDESQKIVSEYKTNSSTNDALIASLTSNLKTANILAGLVDVKGEGVVITLSDSTTSSPELSIEAGLVHDTDITAIVTELKAAGAEAISINGQRIIATTAIRCVGPTIQINSTKVASPFYIKAIGNAQYLESALNIKGGIADSLRSYGITIQVDRQSDLTINKHDGTIKLKTATAVE